MRPPESPEAIINTVINVAGHNPLKLITLGWLAAQAPTRFMAHELVDAINGLQGSYPGLILTGKLKRKPGIYCNALFEPSHLITSTIQYRERLKPVNLYGGKPEMSAGILAAVRALGEWEEEYPDCTLQDVFGERGSGKGEKTRHSATTRLDICRAILEQPEKTTTISELASTLNKSWQIVRKLVDSLKTAGILGTVSETYDFGRRTITLKRLPGNSKRPLHPQDSAEAIVLYTVMSELYVRGQTTINGAYLLDLACTRHPHLNRAKARALLLHRLKRGWKHFAHAESAKDNPLLVEARIGITEEYTTPIADLIARYTTLTSFTEARETWHHEARQAFTNPQQHHHQNFALLMEKYASIVANRVTVTDPRPWEMAITQIMGRESKSFNEVRRALIERTGKKIGEWALKKIIIQSPHFDYVLHPARGRSGSYREGFIYRAGALVKETPAVEPPSTPDIIYARNWRDNAACQYTHPDDFIEEENLPLLTKICNSCTVTAQCLIFAVQSNQQYGVWSGMSPAQLGVYKKGVPAWARRKIAGVDIVSNAAISRLIEKAALDST